MKKTNIGKTLILMRHGDANSACQGQRDYERTLSESGKAFAQKVGELFVEKELQPQIVMVSSAARTLETAAGVLSSFSHQPEIRSMIDLYEKTYQFTEEYLKGLKDIEGPVMVIGHNPHIGELMARLSGEFFSVPPGTAAIFQVEISDWKHFSPKKAILQEVIDPVSLGM